MPWSYLSILPLKSALALERPIRVGASCAKDEAKTYNVIGDGDQQLLEDDTGIFIRLDQEPPVLGSAAHVAKLWQTFAGKKGSKGAVVGPRWSTEYVLRTFILQRGSERLGTEVVKAA